MAQNKTELRKKKIIDTATKVFAQRGFNESTISEIAREAKISEASIYEYFLTKEGLLFSIPAASSHALFDTMAFHLKLIRGAANKLRAIVYLLMDSYQKNPDFATVLMLYLKHNKRFLDTEGHIAIKSGIKQITQVIDQGIETGEFKKDINPYLIRSMILGTIEHLVTNWVMTGSPDDLEQLVDPMIDTIVLGISNTDNLPVHWSLQQPVKQQGVSNKTQAMLDSKS
ncbi:MAG: TetR/AcrR family transcriptional regulator [Proteobacteria bacterium]|nr:TetR/AcrR family transcriptional regulator [Pseudomonadota bacterium]MBU1583590.1 TetR/AcrR family transcriptional regulator [Pseudomonadota bacterium]MBU2453245.1 TetR/AcrR family transcriptional regulator [Pseudomonadota bacterium]MBU2628664.1 TetR/AcrR family transcriptional regulator [Pseudomonadota bacterium]